MTMKDHLCEICRVNEPLGVACTIMPYSCAYCRECAKRFAQPRVVFEYFFEEFGTDLSRFEDPSYAELETFHDGKYVDYRTWVAWRATQASDET
jgi:hypothetical protein